MSLQCNFINVVFPEKCIISEQNEDVQLSNLSFLLLRFQRKVSTFVPSPGDSLLYGAFSLSGEFPFYEYASHLK